jgi:hypothetical protein
LQFHATLSVAQDFSLESLHQPKLSSLQLVSSRALSVLTALTLAATFSAFRKLLAMLYATLWLCFRPQCRANSVKHQLATSTN